MGSEWDRKDLMHYKRGRYLCSTLDTVFPDGPPYVGGPIPWAK